MGVAALSRQYDHNLSFPHNFNVEVSGFYEGPPNFELYCVDASLGI